MRFTRRTLKCVLPHTLMEDITFRKHYGRGINWKNPQLMDEKLLVLKAKHYSNNALIKKCTDKYAVRKYIHEKKLDEILVPLIGVYTSFADIDLDSFPSDFVLKCTHGSGYNWIVTSAHTVNKHSVEKMGKVFDQWMHEDYGLVSGEYHYCGIPRKIIAEKYIGDSKGRLPVDYKFFCSRGNVICCLLIVGRGYEEKWLFVNTDFDDLHFTGDFQDGNIAMLKPPHYSRMVEIAKKLSIDFPFVRVDLYDTLDRIWFGELTFSPHGCIHGYLDREAQIWIGKQIKIG